MSLLTGQGRFSAWANQQFRGVCISPSWVAKAVERSLEDWIDVTGVGMDRRNGDDHVEDLLEGEVVADFEPVLGGGQQRPTGRDHSGPAACENGVAAVRMLEQLGGDVALAPREGEEFFQPGRQRSVSHLCLGAMMFGAFGNPDQDDAIKIIHRALDAGINIIDRPA
jgi:hypothetical protein